MLPDTQRPDPVLFFHMSFLTSSFFAHCDPIYLLIAQAQWSRAAVLASLGVLRLPLPPSSLLLPGDEERCFSLEPHLRVWATTGPKGPLSSQAIQAATAAAASTSTVIPHTVRGANGLAATATVPPQQHGPGGGGMAMMAAAGVGAAAAAAAGVTVMATSSMAPAPGPPLLGPSSSMMRVPPPSGPGPYPPPRPPPRPPQPKVLFNGLLYIEGLDSLGRSVIVLNTAAPLPRALPLDSVLNEVMNAIQPQLSRPYVLVVVNIAIGFSVETVRAAWALGAYRKLSREHRKNVKHLIVVQPSTWAKMLLFLSRPFVSSKAADKVKRVESIVEIPEATRGEVDLHHLGPSFLAFLQQRPG